MPKSAQGPVPYVTPELHAVKMNGRQGLIGQILRSTDVVTQSRHTQYPTTGGQYAPLLIGGSGMKNHAIFVIRRQTRNFIAFSRGQRISMSRSHHPERGSAIPGRLMGRERLGTLDRKSTRLNSSH